MECDSVHAHIENAAKNVNIYDPSGWYTVVQMASKKRRYEVKEMNQSDFVDFVNLRKYFIKNKKITLTGPELYVFNIENLNPTKCFSNIIIMMNISHF